MKIPDKLINEAIELQFKNPTQHDLELFKQGVHCAEILIKDVAIEFGKYLLHYDLHPQYIDSELFEQFIEKKYDYRENL